MIMAYESALPEASHVCGPSDKLFRAFMLLQEKWVLAIVYALLQGPNGFNELSRKASPVNITTLSQRLALLEREGIVTKTIHSMMPPRTTYELTESGRALQQIIEAVSAWSEAYLPDRPAESHDTGGCAAS